jgi:hypothetical protein
MFTPAPPAAESKPQEHSEIKIRTEDLSFFYGSFKALHGVTIEFR